MKLAYCLWLMLAIGLGTTATVRAEQMSAFGPDNAYELHYIIIPTTMLNPSVAETYGITRAADRALINISLLHEDQPTVVGALQGSYKNLLSQTFELEFDEVREQSAIYYLATMRHTDRDILRFTFTVTTTDGLTHTVEHRQQMYNEP